MVKAMYLVIGQGHIIGWATNWLTCFSFHIMRPWHSQDTAIWKVYLENPRSSSWPGSKLTATFQTWCSIIRSFFVSWQSDHFVIRYCKLKFWPRKFKVNYYICFSFRGKWIGSTNPAKSETNPKSCSEVIAWTKSAAGSGIRTGTKNI